LLSLGAQVSVYDKKTRQEMEPNLVQFFKNKDAICYFGEEPTSIDSFNLMIVSPGVPLSLDLVQRGQEAGVEIIGEIELAWRLGRGKYVAITGTNGKTTTTVLTGELFCQAGRRTRVVGNVGIAAVKKAVAADEDTWLITEISSFQLETTKDFHPRISALLNITPDHLDRHQTMENYVNAKATVYRNQDENDYFVVNYDDPVSWKLAKGCKARVVPFSRKQILNFGCFVQGGVIVIRDERGEIHQLCKPDELGIPGAHNLENVLAASAIAFFAGIEPQSIAQTLRMFKGVAHRLEFCGEIKGIRFVNDSKGTNPDASIKAIEAIDGKIILIAGGYDKGSTFTELVNAFDGKVKALILLGKTAPLIKETAKSKGFTNIIMAKDMEECVKEGLRIAEMGDTVLLSPACASWDMYTCFEQRGEHFKSCVRNLAK
ncbi:MAG: UDP-N-acetylmuramoyl-L-alanine--D-glutamate ligase, partial [Eubacteriales bacterium]|nr:UDP-N-acetylmuramoyl-L-alanine--D-glutamate ligase [Eubacteriales bacterium]